MKIINISFFNFPDGKNIKIDNRIPTGKGIEIDDNTIAMNSLSFDFICDVKFNG